MIWKPSVVKGKKLQDFAHWVNAWGDMNKHPESVVAGKRTSFGKGYKKAMSDVFDKLNLTFEKK